MCINVKYEIWNVSQPEAAAVNRLIGSGYAPLAAMILAARGFDSSQAAAQYLSCTGPLIDPFAMRDMGLAAGRLTLGNNTSRTLDMAGTADTYCDFHLHFLLIIRSQQRPPS